MNSETPTVKTDADHAILGQSAGPIRPALIAQMLAVAVLYWIIYQRAFSGLYNNWTLVDSYYSHGFLIPPLSIYLAWMRRRELAATPIKPSPWGYPFIFIAIMFLCSKKPVYFNKGPNLTIQCKICNCFLICNSRNQLYICPY